MTRRIFAFPIAALLALAILFWLPSTCGATVYRVYEYFEGLPDDFFPENGQGYGFKETVTPDLGSSAQYTMGTGDITQNGTTYTCIGWKYGNGVSPATGTENSVTFTISSDVSITWIYQPARKLTVNAVRIAPDASTLWGGGRNDAGQVGDGTTQDSYNLKLVQTGSGHDFVTVSSSHAHTAALTADGSLWTWGWNGYGQLGNNSNINSSTPIRVGAATDFYLDVSVGKFHSVAVRTDGSLWSWGGNQVGQLGNGTTNGSWVPVRGGQGYDWTSVAAGYLHTLAIKRDGTLWAWGENDRGRLGYPISGGNINQVLPKLVGSAGDKWQKAVAGYEHSAGIKADGSLWVWGANGEGQLGDGTTTDRDLPVQIMVGSRWRAVAAGIYHTLAVREDGTLWAWGNQYSGRLGNGNDNGNRRLTPVQIGSAKTWLSVTAGDLASAATRNDGTLWVWGSGPWGGASNAQTKYLVPTQYGSNRDWLKLALTTYKDGQSEMMHAIRAASRVEGFPHLGTRYLPGDLQYTLKARAIPTDGSGPYFLSDYQGGAGAVAPASGSAYQLPVTLSSDTSITWINQRPLLREKVSVGFGSEVPEELKNSTLFFPLAGMTELAKGAVVLSAPPEVTLSDGSVWELYGWTGTGDISGGTSSSVPFTLTQPSAITWKYRQLPDDMTFSYSVPSGGAVSDAEAQLLLYQQSVTAGSWDLVNLPGGRQTKNFANDSSIKLSAMAKVEKEGRTYYCTGISIESAGYRSPVASADVGDRKEFVLTLSAPDASGAPWSLNVTVTYVEAVKVALGEPVPTAGCVAQASALPSRMELVTSANPSDTIDNAFFFGPGSAYAVRPVNFFTLTCDNGQVKSFYAGWGTSSIDNVITGAPINLQPAGSAYRPEKIHYSESFDYEQWDMGDKTRLFLPREGRTLIRFTNSNSDPVFLTVGAKDTAPASGGSCTVGQAIAPGVGEHDDPEGKNGYVYHENAYYDGSGSDAAYNRATRSGDILPVNATVGSTAADRQLVVAWYGRGSGGAVAAIGWPLRLKQYSCTWPAGAEQIVIARVESADRKPGVALSTARQAGYVYNQPDPAQPGFNPNEEHAFLQGGRLYALRTDLNGGETSAAYVLLKYKNTDTGKWAMTAFRVAAEAGLETFSYPVAAGGPIVPPGALGLLPPSPSSLHQAADTAGNAWYFKDHKGGHWARASNGRTDGGRSKVLMQWYYPLQPGFYYPFKDQSGNQVKVGDSVPFQNGGQNHGALPRTVTYLVNWPESAPFLKVGETLTVAGRGLPAVADMAAVKKIHDDGGATPAATLFAPYAERSVVRTLPADIKTTSIGGRVYFDDLPYALRSRLSYDPAARTLAFKGISLDTGTGDPLLLSNVMSAREKARIAALSADSTWADKVEALYQAASAPLAPSEANPLTGSKLALSAGFSRKSGYVVLAENDDPSLGSAPVALHVIKVQEGPYQGEIKVIKSDNPFDEKLTLRHSGDFAGRTDDVYFSWYYQPDNSGLPPRLQATSNDATGWTLYATDKGLNEVTIEGAGKLTLEDNWFMVRYYYGDDPTTTGFDPLYPSLTGTVAIAPAGATDVNLITNNWSTWAGAPGGETAQLAEGWIKRVVNDLNPLDARVSDFRNNQTNTTTSMLSQLGERYSGAVALNGSAENLNGMGLIPAYQTVLDRGETLSIDSPTPVGSPATYNALLNAATRIADFYTLLGNEAYGDAQDPTVAYDTRSGGAGTMDSSLFAFQNQTDSLLEEELALLRGRDSTTSTTQGAPYYNRLIWNFTNGDGEVAYVQTYNVGDLNRDGFVDEKDAKTMYPQGHGDAWGHYLTAMTTWYGLLKNPNYSWVPRIESVLVGSSPVPVDYLDERKLARTAAYKAHAGAEIVDLTYRKFYVDDPAGQWQGYKDNVTVTQNGTPRQRAWGVDDWARRAGQGAYFDWVTANALLPATDTVNSGIQKIDRKGVPELNEIVSHYVVMQFKADEADAGYNPLGLARGVVPFDIDPSLLASGSGREPQSHFEQVYGRAVKALGNARTVYDYAARYTVLIRGNEDSLDVFRQQVDRQELGYLNQLIEVFGYPYSGDIGAGKTYPDGYRGPDIFHFNYMDPPELKGVSAIQSQVVDVKVSIPVLGEDDADLDIGYRTMDLSYSITPGVDWPFVAAQGWGERRAPGEVQMALSELLQANASYGKALATFSAGLADMERSADTLMARYKLAREEIEMVNDTKTTNTALSAVSLGLKLAQIYFVSRSSDIKREGEILVAGLPTVVGTANDPSSALRKLILRGTDILAKVPGHIAIALDAAQQGMEGVIAYNSQLLQYNIALADTRDEMRGLLNEIERAVNALGPMQQDLWVQGEALQQAGGRYYAALAKGMRILDERESFRKRTAGEIQDYRYQDLAFRTFRNDAVQKYRGTFDLAARYAYLAATAYDYETNMLRTDQTSGSNFLTELAKQRSPGVLVDGAPVVGKAGLADPLARLNQNFGVYKTQLGFNNPQSEASPFSLRSELFRINPDSSSDDHWRTLLRSYLVADLNSNDSFKRYCRPFTGDTTAPQPGLVIPFTTEVRFGKNFFGWLLGGGDSSFDPSRFATKIRSVGLWFKGYGDAGLADTPRAYLVPVGMDVLRSPGGDSFEERRWQVVDQKLPVPFPVSDEEIASGDYIPVNDTLSEQFGGMRRFSSIRAYNDTGITATAAESLGQLNTDSSLVGRSVWNTQWLLIIPGGHLLSDPKAGLDTFIGHVSDIRLFFQTYSYSGN